MKKKITDIQVEGKCASRKLLFLDGEQFGSVDSDLIPKFGLRIGLEIEEGVLQKLIEADEGMRAKKYAADCLIDQTYSKVQMVEQLEHKGFGQKVIDTTLEDLEQRGHIKDEKYAKNWVNRRQRSKPRGKKMLKYELTNKGIDKTTVNRVVEGIDAAEEAGLALEVAQKQAKRYKSLPPDVAKRRMHGFLLRRGFDYETIQRVIERVL